MDLLTFGHGTRSQDELVRLLRSTGIQRVVDVRTVPKSRTNPHTERERMATWIPERSGATYRWEPRLGGFRRTRTDSQNTGLRNASFRGYADYMESDDFREALAQLIDGLREARTAVMCSESVWWRCHRRLIADAAVLLHGIPVLHVMDQGKLHPHVPTAGVRRVDSVLRYEDAA